MRYRLRKLPLRWRDTYAITDAEGREAYFVDGRPMTVADKFAIKNPDGVVVGFIMERLLTLGRSYEIFRHRNVAAVMKQALFRPVRDHFTVDVPGPNDYEVTGNFRAREFAITRGGKPAAKISNHFFDGDDVYGIDINAGEDDVLLLAVAIAVDESVN